MKKTVFVLALLTAFFTACSQGGKYGDIKAVLDKMYDANEKYMTDIQKATSASDVASAITAFTETYKSLVPAMKELEKKYSDLDIKDSKYPAELKEYEKKFEEQSLRLEKASTSMMKFMMNKEVSDALQNMGKAMENL